MSGGKVAAPRSMVNHSSPFVNLIFPGLFREPPNGTAFA